MPLFRWPCRLFAGSTPIGATLIGARARTIGVSQTLLVCAALCLLGVVIAARYQRQIAKS